jgi:hypothetical protein
MNNKEGLMDVSKVLVWLEGKKTYIVAILTGILGIISAYHPIPEYVWAILGAAGLGAVRAGIK